jgi:hypothetical protein
MKSLKIASKSQKALKEALKGAGVDTLELKGSEEIIASVRATVKESLTVLNSFNMLSPNDVVIMNEL